MMRKFYMLIVVLIVSCSCAGGDMSVRKRTHGERQRGKEEHKDRRMTQCFSTTVSRRGGAITKCTGGCFRGGGSGGGGGGSRSNSYSSPSRYQSAASGPSLHHGPSTSHVSSPTTSPAAYSAHSSHGSSGRPASFYIGTPATGTSMSHSRSSSGSSIGGGSRKDHHASKGSPVIHLQQSARVLTMNGAPSVTSSSSSDHGKGKSHMSASSSAGSSPSHAGPSGAKKY